MPSSSGTWLGGQVSKASSKSNNKTRDCHQRNSTLKAMVVECDRGRPCGAWWTHVELCPTRGVVAISWKQGSLSHVVVYRISTKRHRESPGIAISEADSEAKETGDGALERR